MIKTRDQATCVLFIEDLDADGCLSLRLNASHDIDAPLLRRSLPDVRSLQVSSRTIVVIPSFKVRIDSLALPWLGERKAREAIPYALEERIAQPLSSFHIAFDKTHYQQGCYTVVVIDKQQLHDYIGLLDELDLDFNEMTVDWFALAPGESYVTPHRVVVHHAAFKGAMSPELAESYMSSCHEEGPCFLFDEKAKEPIELFIAKRLMARPYVNLCQGEFRHDTYHDSSTRWYIILAILLGIWLLTIFSFNAWILHRLHVKQADLDQHVAEIYHTFFPEATQVIQPKFRIEQALKMDGDGKKSSFWSVIGLMVASMPASNDIRLEQLHFQDQTLTIRITCVDFSTLEAFEHRLKKQALHVTQVEAASENKTVLATLELRL